MSIHPPDPSFHRSSNPIESHLSRKTLNLDKQPRNHQPQPQPTTEEEGESAAEATPAAAPAKSNFKGFGEKPKKATPPPKTKAQLEVRACVSAHSGAKASAPRDYPLTSTLNLEHGKSHAYPNTRSARSTRQPTTRWPRRACPSTPSTSARVRALISGVCWCSQHGAGRPTY